MAKVQIPDIANEWPVLLGQALQSAVAVVGWSNKEAAARIGTDDAEFGKWLSGARRTQTDKVFAVAELREPYIVALAKLAGATIRTQIEWERRVG